LCKCFDSITNDPTGWSRDATVDAIALSKCLLDFELIIALHVVERYMSYTESLSRALQARALDIVQAVQHIGVLKQVLTDARSYTCTFDVYLGATAGSVEKDLGIRATLDMTKDVFGKGFHIYCDNFFACPQLAAHLEKEKNLCYWHGEKNKIGYARV